MSEGAIRLTWRDRNWAEQGHYIYRSDTPMDVNNLPNPIDTVDGNVTVYIDYNVIVDQTYFYRVAAFRNNDVLVSDEIEVLAEEIKYPLENMVLYVDPDDLYSYTGDQLIDLSPLGGEITLSGTPLKRDIGLYFNGSSDHGVMYRNDLNGGSFAYGTLTCHIWYKPPTTGNTTQMTSNNVITVENSFEISIGGNNGSSHGLAYASVPWQWREVSGVIPNGEWSLVSFVHGLNFRKLYVNAVEVYSSNESGEITSGNATYPFIAFMKRHISSSIYNEGTLGSVTIYDEVYNGTKVLEYYDLTKFNYGIS